MSLTGIDIYPQTNRHYCMFCGSKGLTYGIKMVDCLTIFWFHRACLAKHLSNLLFGKDKK